ncbi:hypothetical protein SDC9_163444 [bioreactor metagenome]|uniref:Uncharacterized protein n=1 Tax=bioreactor metagenome TaxID=1076179 RepID=A0A645FQW8_9ZZZZ
MNFTLLFCRGVHGANDGDIALQAGVAQGHRVLRLGKHGNANQHQRRVNPGGAHGAELIDAGGGHKSHAAAGKHPRHLRKRRGALNNAGYLHTGILAALNERCQILLQFIQINLQQGITSLVCRHMFASCL